MSARDELIKIAKNPEYKKIYNKVNRIRMDLTMKNQKLLNEGNKNQYERNCIFLHGMTRVIEKLPKP